MDNSINNSLIGTQHNQTHSGSGHNIAGDYNDESTHWNIQGDYHHHAPPQEKLFCPGEQIQKPDHFGGRNQELAHLKQVLKENKDGKPVAIISVQGLGGIGKTTLARQLAHEIYHEKGEERYFRAVLWVNITNDPKLERLLIELASQVAPDLRRGEKEEISEFALRVRNALYWAIKKECIECGPNRTLLVLDDVWKEGVSQVRQINDLRPPNTTVLLTTRSKQVAINLDGQLESLGRLEGQAGVEMLQSYLHANAQLSQNRLEELVKVLDGYTLALKLAARRLREKDIREEALEKLIAKYRQGLTEGTPFEKLKLDPGETREDSLSVTLYYSYTELAPQAQARFRALGALPQDQPFDQGMLAAIWDLQWEDDDEREQAWDEAEEYADELKLAGLLEENQPLKPDKATSKASSEGTSKEVEERRNLSSTSKDSTLLYQYRLHPILHSYARALLKEVPEEYAAATSQYRAWVVAFCAKFIELPPEKWSWLSFYRSHIDTVGAELAKQYKTTQENEDFLRLAQTFAYYTASYLALRLEVHRNEWLDMGLEISRVLKDQQIEAHFLNHLGNIYSSTGQPKPALDYFEQALPILREVGDKRGEAFILANLGVLFLEQGKSEESLEFVEQAQALFQAINAPEAQDLTILVEQIKAGLIRPESDK